MQPGTRLLASTRRRHSATSYNECLDRRGRFVALNFNSPLIDSRFQGQSCRDVEGERHSNRTTVNCSRGAACLSSSLKEDPLRPVRPGRDYWLTVRGEQLTCQIVLLIGLIPVNIEKQHQSERGSGRLALPPPKTEDMDFPRLGIGLCGIGQEQANSHTVVDPAIDAALMAGPHCAAITVVARSTTSLPSSQFIHEYPNNRNTPKATSTKSIPSAGSYAATRLNVRQSE